MTFPILIALLIVLLIHSIKIRKDKRLVIFISTTVLLLSAVFSVIFTAGFIVTGPKGEQIPMYYLMFNFKHDYSISPMEIHSVEFLQTTMLRSEIFEQAR